MTSKVKAQFKPIAFFSLVTITSLAILITNSATANSGSSTPANDLESFQNQIAPPSSENAPPNEYFTINENTTLNKNGVSFRSPLQLAHEFVNGPGGNFIGSTVNSPSSTIGETSTASEVASGSSNGVRLTSWLKHEVAPPTPTVKYNRLLHFGTWINDPTDQTCYNNRAKVLIRDSKVPVTFKATNKCIVETGAWDDPYTGNRYTSTRDVQIDHVVPLKHAYQAGAWKWDYKTRCLYGNFMANNYHLLTVNGHENMAKGDRSPDAYLPPNQKVTCAYIQAWLQIKLAWGLVMFPNEAEAIHQTFQRNNCDLNQFSMDRKELIRQRQAMTETALICNRRTPPPPTTTNL